MAFGFVSAGGAAQNAIEKFLIQRALMQRQQMLDAQGTAEKAKADTRADADLDLRKQEESRIAAAQQQTIKDAENQRNFSRATTIADNALPGDAVDAATQKLLGDQGYGGQMRKVPGIVTQGALQGTDDNGVPQYDVSAQPDTFQMRGGSKYMAARVAAEEKAREDAARREDADKRAGESNDLRRELATTAAANGADSRDLRNQLTQMQIDALKDKTATADKAKSDAAGAVKTGRQGVRELAQSILDDPALDGITGPLSGRRDTFFDGKAIDEKKRLDQLIGQLSLQARGQMKGQGQISDFEGRLLANSVSAIDRAAGPEEVKKHLREIIEAFSGDAPNGGSPSPTPTATPKAGSGFRVVKVHP